MRSDPRDYQLVAPGTLYAVVSLLAEEPGKWLPIAGGTDLMVLYAAGKLPARKLVNIWNIPELRGIEVLPDKIRIGAGSTYTELREHELVAREFPLLARAASWTGGIANQNRGTIGGNIINASPAADSLPPLLVYEAELILTSIRGERRVPYLGFHTGYKTTKLAADELVRAICLPRQFAQYVHHARKVGARNAQAIAKVCIAAVGRLVQGRLDDVRIALGSVAPVPLRLLETERALKGKSIDASFFSLARRMAASEIRPIDDIRSTARYRSWVASNLVEEFLRQLSGCKDLSALLQHWNRLPAEKAASAILPCCGSHAWARGMTARRPLADEAAVLAASDETWHNLAQSDWMEAFQSHPRIGQSRTKQAIPSQAAAWSAHEQERITDADAAVKIALEQGNREYERRFGRIFIVCATGKSAAEILDIQRRRLQNDPQSELRESVEQQRQITQIRLRKWLQE